MSSSHASSLRIANPNANINTALAYLPAPCLARGGHCCRICTLLAGRLRGYRRFPKGSRRRARERKPGAGQQGYNETLHTLDRTGYNSSSRPENGFGLTVLRKIMLKTNAIVKRGLLLMVKYGFIETGNTTVSDRWSLD